MSSLSGEQRYRKCTYYYYKPFVCFRISAGRWVRSGGRWGRRGRGVGRRNEMGRQAGKWCNEFNREQCLIRIIIVKYMRSVQPPTQPNPSTTPQPASSSSPTFQFTATASKVVESCTAYGCQSPDHLRVHKRVSLQGTTRYQQPRKGVLCEFNREQRCIRIIIAKSVCSVQAATGPFADSVRLQCQPIVFQELIAFVVISKQGRTGMGILYLEYLLDECGVQTAVAYRRIMSHRI